MADSLGNAGEHIRLEYVPRAGLGRLAIVNFLLNVVTLTLYRFWAKTNVRKHIWSCVHINGQPLEYTGRGIELFKGALIVFGLFVLPFVLVATFTTLPWGRSTLPCLPFMACSTFSSSCFGAQRSTGPGVTSFRAPCGAASGERWWDPR